jgi:hypothetical protein
MIKYKNLKKGDMIRSTQLGNPISGKLLESPKQGRGLKRTILIFTNGEDMGLHAEAGSIYAHQLTEVVRDGSWHQVTGQPKTQDQDAMLDQLTTQ